MLPARPRRTCVLQHVSIYIYLQIRTWKEKMARKFAPVMWPKVVKNYSCALTIRGHSLTSPSLEADRSYSEQRTAPSPFPLESISFPWSREARILLLKGSYGEAVGKERDQRLKSV